MNFVKKYRLVLLRAFGLTLICLILFSAEQSEAQLIRGRWQRIPSVDKDLKGQENPPNRSDRQSISSAAIRPNSANRFNDRWRRPAPLNVIDNESRYIGGLHYSYFQNLGIPTGDIGLRGNGVFWRPW